VVVEEPQRRRPQTVGGVVYLAVVSATVAGLALSLLGAWRTGVVWVGGGLLLGACSRAVLPERQSGMLRVRRKPVDVMMLLGVGVALIVLALVIPEQPG
jgi:multisubunit Na+/H+ antiporter MnhB subunit